MMISKWEFQRNANILAFLTAPEYAERKKILEKVSKTFAKAGVSWALSCSSSLFFRGLIDDFNDFDILVDINDVEALKSSMRQIGANLEEETIQKGYFTSPYYQQAQLGKCDFDLIGDITVNTFGGTYCYPVSKEEIEYVFIDGNIIVPIVPVEASMLLYGMMEGWQSRRRWKREICYTYLKKTGLKYPKVLERGLEQDIPRWLIEVVSALLK